MTGQPPRPGRRSVLVDQQLWYLGRDIAAPTGNALVAYGFHRRRSRAGAGSSAYTLPCRDGIETSACQPPSSASAQAFRAEVLICWGFGLYLGHDPEVGDRPPGEWAGIVVERFRPAPTLVRVPPALGVHLVTALPRQYTPCGPAQRALVRWATQLVAEQFVRYEQWAIDALGHAHRTAALAAAPRHKRRRFEAALHLAPVWRRMLPERDPLGAWGSPPAA